jgi:endonuclease/exonuclease/phosphatase family metal-dependent hydrolase
VTGAPRDPARLRVVTWNIRAAIGPGEPFPPAWWRHVRRARLERIGAILVDLDADVATLQEVTIMTPGGELHDQPAELARLTGRHVRYAATHSFVLVEPETGRSVGSAMWGNAVLSRAPLEDGYAIGLPRAADRDAIEPAGDPHVLAGVAYADAEPGHREPRCVVGGRVAGVSVATAHVTYIGRAQRRAQVEAVAGAVARAPDPVVVTGDYNAPIDAPEMAGLADGFVDAFAAVGVGPGDARRASCGPWPIDHVLVRGLTVESCRAATEAGDASDHWPVVADLRRG